MEKTTRRSNRLGKGLGALIPTIKEDIDPKDIVSIQISQIYANPDQPRKIFDPEKIEILSNSIRNYGVLQPIVSGERRFRASKKARLTEIPAVIKDIPIKDIMEIALIENLQREDLNAIEEAIAYKSLIDNYNVTQEEISEAVGKSRPHITNTLRLLNLGKEVIAMIEDNRITPGHGKALLRVSDEIAQLQIANKVIEEELSVRETENIAKKFSENQQIENIKKKKEKDIYILDVEEKLAHILGTKVNISKGRKKGKIEIEYYNDDDLNNIISLLIEE